MRNFRWALFPITFAWFGFVWWWLARPGGCACVDPPVTVNTATTSVTAAVPAVVAPAPVAAASTPDPSPMPAMVVIPFVKNHGAGTGTDDLQALAAQAVPLLQASADRMVVVTGHTDADGDADLNVRLSRERAEAVAAQLIAMGVPADRIRTEGAGASHPVADNITSKGKALNRRVEVVLVDARTKEPSTAHDALP